MMTHYGLLTHVKIEAAPCTSLTMAAELSSSFILDVHIPLLLD